VSTHLYLTDSVLDLIKAGEHLAVGFFYIRVQCLKTGSNMLDCTGPLKEQYSRKGLFPAPDKLLNNQRMVLRGVVGSAGATSKGHVAIDPVHFVLSPLLISGLALVGGNASVEVGDVDSEDGFVHGSVANKGTIEKEGARKAPLSQSVTQRNRGQIRA